MPKSIPVRFDPKHGSLKKLAGLPTATVWNCDPLQTLVLIGYLTSPPMFPRLGLINYWAWLRYAPAIHRAGSHLKLRRMWGDQDPHQKTILADDFGMGFPCHYLIDMHGFEDFADTNYLLEHLLKGVVNHASKPKRGAAKSPDFIAVDSLGCLHNLECKGTQTSKAYLAKAMATGVDQKNNLSNSNIFQSCMVGGIYVPQFKSQETAEIVFVDPDPGPMAQILEKLGIDKVAQATRRVSLAKNLTAAGLVHSATAILVGTVKNVAPEFLRGMGLSELSFAGYRKTESEFWERTLEYKSYETDDSSPESLRPTVTKMTSRIPEALILFLRESVSQRGELPAPLVDNWITKTLANRRKERRVSAKVRVTDEEKEFTKSDRTVLGSWSPLEDADKVARGWTTGMGFQFAIESTNAE